MEGDKKVTDVVRGIFSDSDFVQKLQSLIETAVSRALEQRDAKIAALELELTATRSELVSTQERLTAAERGLEILEAESRKSCLVISGVPELPNEDTGSLALEVAKAAGVTLSADDLDRSHRLGRPSTATSTATIDKPRAILVKFGAHQKRQNLFSARKNMSGHRVAYHPVLTSQVLDKVYISDFLTPKSQNMLYICRQLKRDGHIWAAYSSNGKVKIRMEENQSPKTISNLSELRTILGAKSWHIDAILEAGRDVTRRSGAAEATGGRSTDIPTAAGRTQGPTTSRPTTGTGRAAGAPSDAPAANNGPRTQRVAGQPN